MAQKTKIEKWQDTSEKNKRALDFIDKDRTFVYGYETFERMAKYYKSRERLEAKHNILPQDGPALLPLLDELNKHWQSGM